MLGHHMLDWTPEQKKTKHEARMQGRLVKPHRYRAGTAALNDIRHFQKTSALLIWRLPFQRLVMQIAQDFQDRPAVPVSGDTVSPGSSRGIPGRAVRGRQPVCHPCQASYHHAKGHQVGKTNPGRECVEAPPQKHKHLGPSQDHPHTPKGVAFEVLKDPCYKLKYPIEGKICPKYLC